MLKLAFLILSFLIPISSQAEIQPGPLTLVLVGQKETVLSVLNEAMNIEFSRGVTTPMSENLGFNSSFPGFLTGQTDVRAWLNPLADGDSVEPTAYSISFWWRTQRSDGKSHVTSLISQIKTIVNKHGNVAIAENLSAYRDLGEQLRHCKAKLKDDPQLDAIKDKIALDNADNATFAMLANDSTPTENEKQAIALFASKRDHCNKLFAAAQVYYPNDPTTPLFRTVLDTVNQVTMSLYKGQLSYGDYERILKKNNSLYQEGRLKIINEAKAQNAEANEKAQRLALEQQHVFIEQQKVYADMYRPAVVPAPVNRLRSTNCQINGNQMDCTTF